MAAPGRPQEHVPQPNARVLDVEDVFDEEGKPRDELLLAHFKQEGRVTQRVALRILREAAEVFRAEPNVLEVPAPVIIVGDIHGQFFDLVKMFSIADDTVATKYLFLGDYVDRGYFSLECVLYLWALKLRHPQNFFFLRGNHECRHLTEYFTFKTEVEYKICSEVYDECMDCFDCLPLVAIMNKQFFCVHGGLSPELNTVDDIQRVNRFVEPDEMGLLCDLLWSDPHEDYETYEGNAEFMHNSTRGCSYVYTHKAVCNFLDKNKLLSVIRAHEAQDQGYRMYKPNPSSGFPSVITIFSAPNYLDVYNNKAAIMIYADNAMNIKKFSHSPHPYWLPNFMDVFTWSLPFIGEKTSEMLMHVMGVCSEDELRQAKDNSDLEALAEKMRAALAVVNSQQQSYRDLSSKNQSALVLQGATSPTGEYSGDIKAIQDKILSFEGVKELDKKNEANPTQSEVSKARTFRRRQTLEDVTVDAS